MAFPWLQPLVWICFLSFLSLARTSSTSQNRLQDYRDHPCIRTCTRNDIRVCEYNFTVESYHTMTKACYDCPFNVEDCYRPHCVSTDGVDRGLITVNRMLPGPAIQVCENDVVVVNVYNRMEVGESTTVHWHGVHQRGSQFMDGLEQVTQCSIPPHSTFQYKFNASTTGTHWWHSHTGLQRADGMYGAFIVRQSMENEVHYSRYDFDLPEHYIFITDWLTELTVNRFTRHHHSDGDNKPKSMLINGLGVYRMFTNETSRETSYTPRAEYNVTSGKRYRFRLISSAILNCPIAFTIDNHKLTVIASDGAPFEPYEVSTIVVYAGERFDFILTTDQAIGNYWIRVYGLADCGGEFSKATQTGILRYQGAAKNNPPGATDFDSNAASSRGKLLNPFNRKGDASNTPIVEMTSLLPDDATSKPEADVTFHLAMDFNKIDNMHFHDPEFYPIYSVIKNKHLYSPQMNGITMMFPPSPPLSQLQDIPQDMFCNAETVNRNCSSEFCQCVHLLRAPLHSVVEVILVDEGVTFDANHPTHLHGYNFRVVGIDKINKSTSMEEIKRMDRQGLLPRKLSRAPAKDSVTVPDGGYVILRFVADNPGFWLMHCHIAFHAQIGMSVLFQVGDPSDMPKVPRDFPKCGNWKYTGDCTGDNGQPCTSAGPPQTRPGSLVGYAFLLTLFLSVSQIRSILTR